MNLQQLLDLFSKAAVITAPILPIPATVAALLDTVRNLNLTLPTKPDGSAFSRDELVALIEQKAAAAHAAWHAGDDVTTTKEPVQ